MAFQMDEVWVYQGQLKVNEPNNEPEWTKVTGENKVDWATYLQGPVQIGDSGTYGDVKATLMVGPDTNSKSSSPFDSLNVNGHMTIDDGNLHTSNLLTCTGQGCEWSIYSSLSFYDLLCF